MGAHGVILLLAFQVAGDPVEQVSSINSQALDYIKVLLILGGILIVAYLGLRIWMPKLTGLAGAAAGPIQIVGRLAIEPRKTLYLIRTGQEHFLIGASENDIHYLTSVNSVQPEPLVQEQAGATLLNKL